MLSSHAPPLMHLEVASTRHLRKRRISRSVMHRRRHSMRSCDVTCTRVSGNVHGIERLRGGAVVQPFFQTVGARAGGEGEARGGGHRTGTHFDRCSARFARCCPSHPRFSLRALVRCATTTEFHFAGSGSHFTDSGLSQLRCFAVSYPR